MEVAATLGARGITTYVFESLRPTPVLSFAVRHLHTVSGIVLTASHNPLNITDTKYTVKMVDSYLQKKQMS